MAISTWIAKLYSSRKASARSAVPEPACGSARKEAEALKSRGNEHLSKGEFEAARDCYERAIAIDPAYADVHNNLGFVCLRLDRLVDAERHLRRATALKPDLANAHYNLGTLYQRKPTDRDAAQKAIACFQTAIALAPSLAEAHYELGNQFLGQGRLDAAALHYRQVIDLMPAHHQAHNNLGLALLRQEKLDAAMSCFQEAIRLDPDSMAAHKNLGDLLFRQGRLDEALLSIDRAIALEPGLADAYTTRGLVLKGQDRLDEAVDSFEQALRLDPGNAATRFTLATAHLTRGELTLGWSGYKHRFFVDSPTCHRDFPQPIWAGEELRDKTILVWGDQGIGDEMLFASMFPEIVARARHCIIECAPKLVPLFARSFPAAVVAPRANPPHPATKAGADFQIAAGDAARWLRPSLASFPGNDGYLVADPARVAYWKTRLAALGPGFKVGFCWRSSVRSSFRNLHYTSLDQWGPIFAVPGVHFINLQYDDCGEELAAARRRFGVPLHAFAEVDLFNDLDEAAALTKAMDLVITAPTAASGLAAAQGVPTWELGYGTTWVSLGTDQVPWFPSQRLFMRRWDRPWEETVAKVAEHLHALQFR